MIVDANDLILGRLATRVAKMALLGETVHVVNSERAVITGDKRKTIARYKNRRERGAPMVGPFFPRMPDRLVKRTIRGMFDYNKPRGKAAFARIKCHIGVPDSLKDKEFVSFPEISVGKTHAQFIYVADISRELGDKF